MGRFEVQRQVGLALLRTVCDEDAIDLAPNVYLPALTENVTSELYESEVHENLRVGEPPLCPEHQGG